MNERLIAAVPCSKLVRCVSPSGSAVFLLLRPCQNGAAAMRRRPLRGAARPPRAGPAHGRALLRWRMYRAVPRARHGGIVREAFAENWGGALHRRSRRRMVRVDAPAKAARGLAARCPGRAGAHADWGLHPPVG